jgi:hypothetical protein
MNSTAASQGSTQTSLERSRTPHRHRLDPSSVPCTCRSAQQLPNEWIDYSKPYPHQAACPTGRLRDRYIQTAYQYVRAAEMLRKNHDKQMGKGFPRPASGAQQTLTNRCSSHGHAQTRECSEVEECENIALAMTVYALRVGGYHAGEKTWTRMANIQRAPEDASREEAREWLAERLDPEWLQLSEAHANAASLQSLYSDGGRALASCYDRLVHLPSVETLGVGLEHPNYTTSMSDEDKLVVLQKIVASPDDLQPPASLYYNTPVDSAQALHDLRYRKVSDAIAASQSARANRHSTIATYTR